MESAEDRITALIELGNSFEGNDTEKSQKTDQLKSLVEDLKKEQDAHNLALVAEKLADAARNESWRIPIGDSGILGLVLSSIPAEGLQHPLNRQALRLIGNSCADCDENRARVVESGQLSSTIKEFMNDDTLVPFAIAATLNACVDYEKAQLQVCEAGLSKILIDIVSGPRLPNVHISHVMTILEMLSNQAPEPKFANPQTPALLLKLATGNDYEADLDTFLEICSPALAYLTHQDLQTPFLSNGGLPLLQEAFYQSYTRFDTTNTDPDTTNQLKQIWATFVAIFADISAQPLFSTVCSLSSPEAQTLVTWLDQHAQQPHLQTAACLSLGNLSRSDEITLALLPKVQSALCSILSRSIPPQPAGTVPPLQLIHATLSFLKNLAIPAANKPSIGSSLLPDVLPKLWTTTSTQPQLQFTAISLARLLLVNCPENITLVISPIASFPDHPSVLSLLSSTAEEAEESPIKMESARAVVSVCRALHSPPSSSSSSSSSSSASSILNKNSSWTSLRSFYEAHAKIIVTSFSRLIAQPKFPPIKTDAIFVLALMSRSDEDSGAGAEAARKVLEEDVQVFRSVVTAVTGDDDKLVTELLGGDENTGRVEEIKEEGEPQGDEQTKDAAMADSLDGLSLEPKQIDVQAKMQPVGMSKIDRENGLVLVAALLQKFGGELPAAKKKLFEDVLNKGGELVVKDRESSR